MRIRYITEKEYISELKQQLEQEERYLKLLDPESLLTKQCKRKIEELKDEIENFENRKGA